MTPRRGKRRWLWLALLALLVAGIGGHAVLWHVSERRLEQDFAYWLAQRQHAGWSIQTQSPVRGGYPLAASLRVPGMVSRGHAAAIQGGITWRAEAVELRVTLWQPRLLHVSAVGAQMLQVGDGPEIPFRADRLRLVVPLEPGFPRWGEVSVTQLRAGLPAGDRAAGLTVQGFHARADLRPAAPQGEAAITVSAQATAIRLPDHIPPDHIPPDHIPWALGPDIAAIDLNASLGGPLPRGGTPVQAASQWRDGGGTVEVEQLRLRWGKLDLTTSATLALDAQLQPMGTGTARMTGQAAALDAMVAAGALKANVAQMAKVVMTLFAAPAQEAGASDADGEQAVEVPLSLQDRRLSMRQLPLARLPVLAWPGR